MPKTLTEVTRDAAELPAPERLKLARLLLGLAEPDTESLAEAEDAWDEEIERRLQELRSDKVKGVPLEQVRKAIESGFRS
jgi:putative addiction module component (TIGR02574 family)